MNQPAPAFEAAVDQPTSGALRRTSSAGARAARLAMIGVWMAEADLAE
jgi:hypothetical protein